LLSDLSAGPAAMDASVEKLDGGRLDSLTHAMIPQSNMNTEK
jgi:hypothetical protein